MDERGLVCPHYDNRINLNVMIYWIEKYLKEAEIMIVETKVDEGLGMLHKLLYEEPGYASLHNHLGWAYFYYSVDLARAENHFLVAIKFDPKFAPPYLHLGNLYIDKGLYNEALSILERGLSAHQANKVAILERMANAYELKTEFRMAIRYYKRAMAATVGFDANTYSEGIKRCRKKRWALMLTF